MEVEKTSPTESFPMNGGDGRYSYVKNSSLQRIGLDASKGLIESSIAEKLDLINLPHSNTFRIADLGCSTGPNTFIAVQNIIEAIDLKYKSLSLSKTQEEKTQSFEYHVFFNDHTFNDFNTLFASLPERNYYAAGVPGSFYTRLFPKSSLHFVHSSSSLNWLSKVPKEIVDVKGSAWNKGRIHYTNAPEEVVEAYKAQYVKDMEAFLAARAQEVVLGGLVALVVPSIPNGTPTSQDTIGILFDTLGACLMDMANMGTVSEDKVDSFNLPLYTTSPEEIETLVLENGCFSIEKMEPIPGMSLKGASLIPDAAYSLLIRAVLEGIIIKHFGSEIIDELFNRFTKKLKECFSILQTGISIQLFVLLKRKPNA